MNDLALVTAGLARKKLRTALLVLAVFVAFTVYAVLASFQSALSGSLGGADGDRLMVQNKVSFTQNLPFAHVERVRGITGVQDVSYSQYVGGYYQQSRNFLLAFAVEPESWLRIHPELVASEADLQAFARQRDSVMVGRSVAERFGWKVGDLVPVSSHMWTGKDGSNVWPVVVRVIYDGAGAESATEQVFMHYSYLDGARTTARGEIGYVHVLPEAGASVGQLTNDIDAAFANSAAETRTTSEVGFYAAFVEQQGSVGLMVASVTLAGLITSLLIVANAMMSSIRERSAEFATMRAIGFTPLRLARVVLGETLAITVIGGGLGLVVGAWLIGYLRGFGMFFSSMTLTPLVVATAVGLMVMLALLTGGWPALKAMRVNVTSAFRGA